MLTSPGCDASEGAESRIGLFGAAGKARPRKDVEDSAAETARVYTNVATRKLQPTMAAAGHLRLEEDAA